MKPARERIVRAVLMHLCIAATSKRPCPTDLELAELIDCSTRSVGDAIAQLRAWGTVATSGVPYRVVYILKGPCAGKQTAPAQKKPFSSPTPAIALEPDYGMGFHNNVNAKDGGLFTGIRPADRRTYGGVAQYGR